MILLVAMIGAIVLTLRHKERVKRQSISAQNARTPEMSMKVVKVRQGQGLGSNAVGSDSVGSNP
jgi:NADH-quinone oxidoreductase subunit J